jgi:NAD-dependent dihydropyrimidine dehydrogenase PreA subunit
MKRLSVIWIPILQTLLRVLPFPCQTGLVRIGTPGPSSPVFLTGNFRLTLERVQRALEGIDAYLLVANSHGVNVWCSATGGLLSNHDVISVLKTSGIEDLVHHRQVILPQLAATGIEGEIIREKTGWRVVWGPVYAKSIRAFLSNGLVKTAEMRTVSFPWQQRLEMAVAWAFPISLLSLLVFPFWREGLLPLVGLVWGWALFIFLGFPLYQSRLRTKGKSHGFVFFDFGERGVPLFLWLLFVLGLVAYTTLTHDFSWAAASRWGMGSLIVVLILGLDLRGSTPVYKSGLHEDRLWRIVLDAKRCKGAGFCEQVCPRDVFEVDHNRRVASLSRSEQCVQCGACIVQCPFDALYFRSPKGDIVAPDTIRRFKLNLLGKRKVTSRPAAKATHEDGHIPKRSFGFAQVWQRLQRSCPSRLLAVKPILQRVLRTVDIISIMEHRLPDTETRSQERYRELRPL